MTLTEAYERRLEFYNKNHDPRDGRFTTGVHTGKVWTGVSANPNHRTKPTPTDVKFSKALAKHVYETDLGGGYSSHVTEANVFDTGSGDVLTVRGEIRLNGQRRGYFERSLYRHQTGLLKSSPTGRPEDGMITADHELLVIEGDHKGHGLADRFNAHAVAEYQRMGVDRITLTAGDGEYTVGGYAWARQGFRLNQATAAANSAFIDRSLSRIDTQLLKPVYREHAVQIRLEVAALKKALAAGEDIQPIHIASIGERYARHETADEEGVKYQTWPGKDVLLGTSWKAVYYFDANKPLTADATDLEHADLRPKFRYEWIDFYNHNHDPHDGKFATAGGGGGVMRDTDEIDFHNGAVSSEDADEDGMVKHLGSLLTAAEMTDRERSGLESDLGSMEIKDFSLGSTEPFAIAVAMSHANVAVVSHATVAISVQLNAIYNRYQDDFDIMDKVTEALDRYEESGSDVRGARSTLHRELERVTGVSVASGFVSHMNESWAVGPSSPESIAVQLQLAKTHNLVGAMTSMKKHRTAEQVAAGQAHLKAAPNAIAAIADATYRLTQRQLAKHGVTEVELYRGVTINGPRAGTIIAQPNPLSSWTTNEHTAMQFSYHGAIYKARVPVSHVYSLANLSGTGALGENEVILLGHPTNATLHGEPVTSSGEEIPIVELP